MKKRNSKTIRDLVEMLRQERKKAGKLLEELSMQTAVAKRWEELSNLGVEKTKEARSQVKELEARIADLEARPAAPSVEDVAYALTVYLNTSMGAHEMLCSMFDVGWDEADKAWREAKERHKASKDDAS